MESSINRNGTAVRTFEERKICYRNLLNKVEEIEEKKELGIQTVTEVGNILREINELEKEYTIEERVDQTEETLLDCIVLSTSSNILVKCIKSLDISTVSYEPLEFCDKLKSTLVGENGEFQLRDLSKLLTEADHLIREVPPFEYLFGTCDLQKAPEVKQKVVKKITREKFTKKEPEKVNTVEGEEKAIEEIVEKLYNALLKAYTKNGNQPIGYYNYVLDNDFTKTVENMFYFSFLIRDGKARIDLDGSNPTITPIRKEEFKKFRSEGGNNTQMISTITMDDWEALVAKKKL